MNPAAESRREKTSHPERYCVDARCLWRVETRAGRKPCPRHMRDEIEAALREALDSQPAFCSRCNQGHPVRDGLCEHCGGFEDTDLTMGAEECEWPAIDDETEDLEGASFQSAQQRAGESVS
jgi:hypothetical protein